LALKIKEQSIANRRFPFVSTTVCRRKLVLCVYGFSITAEAEAVTASDAKVTTAVRHRVPFYTTISICPFNHIAARSL
jgi:hypothetical protein